MIRGRQECYFIGNVMTNTRYRNLFILSSTNCNTGHRLVAAKWPLKKCIYFQAKRNVKVNASPLKPRELS